jgi:hypothetical protein
VLPALRYQYYLHISIFAGATHRAIFEDILLEAPREKTSSFLTIFSEIIM